MRKVLLSLSLGILLTLALAGTAAADPSSPAAVRLAPAGSAGPVTLLSDDFESGQHWDAGFSGWNIVTPDASFDPLPSPTHAAYAAEFGSPMLVYGPFDLSHATAATLSFELWYDSPSLVISPYTQCGAFLIGYSTNGSDFAFPTQWSGSTDQSWQQMQVDLSSWYDQTSQSTISLLGDPQVWIALSSSVTSPTWANSTEGSYVDDLSLTATIPDTTPPTTTVSGCDANWHRTPVTLHFSATDNAGGSGVDHTQYSTDGGNNWTVADSVVVAAPADHLGDGVHTISYESVDNAGNWETAKTCQVKIDTTGPATYALKSLSVRRDAYVTFPYKVTDKLSPTAKVTLKVYNAHKKLAKSISLGAKKTGVSLGYRLRVTLARGSYTYRIYASDLAGNTQSRLGWNRLAVK